MGQARNKQRRDFERAARSNDNGKAFLDVVAGFQREARQAAMKNGVKIMVGAIAVTAGIGFIGSTVAHNIIEGNWGVIPVVILVGAACLLTGIISAIWHTAHKDGA